jgi:hypothetical protein
VSPLSQPMINKFSVSALLCIAAPVAAQACAIAPGSVLVADSSSGADAIYAAQPLGFAFPLGGTTYTDISLSDHGFGFLSNGGVPAVPTSGGITYSVDTADFIGNGPCVSAFWNDSTLGTGGTLTMEPGAAECVITWLDCQTFSNQLPLFSVQMTLKITGEIVMRYDADTDNRESTFTAGFADMIVGVTPGAPALLPTASDLSTSPVTADDTVFEEFFAISSFDLAGNGLQFVPTNPGWIVTMTGPPTGCAGVTSFGAGCGIGGQDVFYEEFPAGGLDIMSGTTITMLRSAQGYIVLDAIPGIFVTPVTPLLVAAGALDGTETFPLSAPMPTTGGTTSDITISTKGSVDLSAISNGVDFDPTVADLLAWTEPSIAALWHDWDQSDPASGDITFEEIGGIAYATWNDIVTFSGTGLLNKFQVQFEIATGNITIVYDTVNDDVLNHLVGFTAGAPVIDNGPTDISVDLANSLTLVDAGTGILTLGTNLPALGTNWDLTTTNIDVASPVSITFFGVGTAAAPLPFSVIGLDAPGCFVNIDSILAQLTGLSVSGNSLVSLPIPNNPSITGATISAQSICLTLGNPVNLLSSNAVLGTVGI